MAKDKRYFVTCTMEIYVPDQGCGDRAIPNENLDANWFASTIGYMIPNLVNKEFKYSERPYSVNHVYINKVENYLKNCLTCIALFRIFRYKK